MQALFELEHHIVFANVSLINVILITDIRNWFSNIEQHASEGVNKILIGNKCDWLEKKVSQ